MQKKSNRQSFLMGRSVYYLVVRNAVEVGGLNREGTADERRGKLHMPVSLRSIS